MKWDRLTTVTINHLDRRIPVLLPIGATEQHGSHLPLATDHLIGQQLCELLDSELSDKVLILPSVPIGCSAHHMDFAGTLSISHKTFIELVCEILESVVAHGFRNLIIFNSHGGNNAVGQVVVERFGSAHPECRIVLAVWWLIAARELARISETGPGGVGHACEFETSLMLCSNPDLVDISAIKPGENKDTFGWARGDMLRSSQASLYRSFKGMTDNGVFGDPTKASKEKGMMIEQAVISELKKIVIDLHLHYFQRVPT